MPLLIRLYVIQVIVGFALSAGFVALLLALDMAGLRRLVLGSDMGWLAVLMLWVFNGIVFAGVQFGIRIMRMAEPQGDEPTRGCRDGTDDGLRLALPVEAPARRPR